MTNRLSESAITVAFLLNKESTMLRIMPSLTAERSAIFQNIALLFLTIYPHKSAVSCFSLFGDEF